MAAIHGDLPQTTRDRVMRGFRSGQISVLVATDVVGRGIDVEDISHVINYDMPDDPENYVHRIGRTGRMGKDGIAYLFVCPDQGEPLTAIENLINRVIPPLQIEGFTQTRAGIEPSARELFNHRRDAVARPGNALANDRYVREILTRPRARKSPSGVFRAVSPSHSAHRPCPYRTRSHRAVSRPACFPDRRSRVSSGTPCGASSGVKAPAGRPIPSCR